MRKIRMILSIEHRGTEARRKIYFYEYPQLANVGAGFARLYVSTWMFSGRQTLPLQVIGIMYDLLFQGFRACLNFAQVNFANCFRGCFSDFMRRIAGYLTNKIGKTDRKQTQKNLIEYYFIGKFKQALNCTS